MFCGHCGNKVPDGARYCPHCSNKMETENKMQVNKVDVAVNKYLLNVMQIVVVIMLAILAIKFINTGMDRWDGNLDAFYWVNDSDATLGKIMHWLIVIIVAGTCIECGFYVLAQKKPASLLIKNGFSVFSYGILLKFGNTVFDDWAFDDDMSIVLYRIFGTYEEHVKITIYIGLILVGIGFFLLKVVQKANE